MTDPFAPIGGERGEPAPKTPAWRHVAPVPADAPEPPARHPKLGAPSRQWTYRDADGLLFFILRFENEGQKTFRPLALYAAAKTGALSWRWESVPAPRPLYGLDRLAARPGASVLVCEGEKSADAAERLAPDFIAVTSPAGAQSPGKADWSVLRGRRVVIWPDADKPGDVYAKAVAALCSAAGAGSVAIASPPGGVAEGWDAADAEEEGWTVDRAKALIDGAAPFASAKKAKAENSEDKPAGRRRPPQRDSLIGLTEFCDFWHGPDGETFVTYPLNGHRPNAKIRSKAFKTWLTGQAYVQQGVIPGGQALEDALRFLEGRALNDGPEREPWKRGGATADAWYVDLCDAQWRAVEIRAGGWRIVEKHGLPFVRSPSMLALPEPEAGEMIETLRRFVNVAADHDFMNVIAWLMAALHHRGEYPILVIQAEQGAGKSTLSRLLRSIVDPNLAPIRSSPKDEEDLIVSARGSKVLAFDNLSKVDAWLSDALCRVSTGGGFATRVRYSDSDENVVWTCNPIMVNGIPALAERPDLARRSLIVRLKAIPPEERMAEDDLWREWEKAAPGVLGALLDALAMAQRRMPEIKLTRSSSMAYFEKLMEAASPALGWQPGEFGAAYAENQTDLEGAAFEADPVAMAIADLIRDDYPRGWSGTATRLLELLAAKVSDGMKRSRQWPQSAQGLGNRIERVKPLLRSRDIFIERKHSGERTITIVPKAE